MNVLTDKTITFYSIKLLFYTFIFFTLVSSYLSYSTGYYGGDILLLHIAYSNKYLYYLSYYFISLFLFYYLFFYSIKLNFRYKITNIKSNKIDLFVHYLFLILNLFFLYLVTQTSIGTSSREEVGYRFLALIYGLLQPPLLMIIYLYYYKKSKSMIYKINFYILIIAFFFTGFTGYILYFIPFILSRLSKIMSLTKLLVLGFLLIPFLPILRIYKYALTYHLSFNDIYYKINVAFLEDFARGMVDRFNYVPNMLLIEQNKFYFTELFQKSDLYPFFQGYLGSLYYKIFSGDSVGNINSAVHYLVSGERDSNSTFPLVSYFSIDISLGIFILFYTVILYFILLFMIKIIAYNNIYFIYLCFFQTYSILLQGWYWPYMNLIQALFIFITFILIVNSFKKLKLTKMLNPILANKQN